MLGAIVGDIVGSPYEFTPNNIKTENFPLFKAESHATDDTVMTLAVAEALMQSWGGTDEEIRAALIASMRAWGIPGLITATATVPPCVFPLPPGWLLRWKRRAVLRNFRLWSRIITRRASRGRLRRLRPYSWRGRANPEQRCGPG